MPIGQIFFTFRTKTEISLVSEINLKWVLGKSKTGERKTKERGDRLFFIYNYTQYTYALYKQKNPLGIEKLF